MTDSSKKKTANSQQNQSQLRRTKMRPTGQNIEGGNGTNKNTRAEFKRLKEKEEPVF